ncbi:trypsin-like peptidase domain-containing protein [Hydromonas duriensis]|uniref:Serine protease Do n=1 Tax=Hydromonas duriensis TaxID=1527608 RepID=A0A4V3DK16_9BURK|nr:trypsin-like peptidase domain-containing protein [Hydromonas duriensis]TDR32306.1 serine protease Do [Hydromonas duriensis]
MHPRALPIFFKRLLGFTALLLAAQAQAAPNVSQIINDSADSIVSVHALKWVKVKLPEQYKGVTQDPVYQVFSRMFNTDEIVPATNTEAPIVKKKNQGNGFIIANNGVIVTNYHTIVNANEIYVQLFDKRRLKATVLRTQPKQDLAILKVANNNLPALPLATDINEGEWVLALGANKNGISAGTIVSTLNSQHVQELVTDVDIDSNNSGGPLLNIKGEVLAMNSNLLKAPMGLTRHALIGKLINSKDLHAALPKTWQKLGFSASNIEEKQQKELNLADATGAWVRSITPNSIASHSGLQINDIIIALESQKVVDISDLNALGDFLAEDDSVNLSILRNGERKIIQFTVPKPNNPNDPSNLFTWKKLGLKLRPMSAAQKATVNTTAGVQITEAQNPAMAAGLQVGDFLLNLNQQDIKSIEQIEQTAKGLTSGDTVFVYVVRGAIRQFVGINITD